MGLLQSHKGSFVVVAFAIILACHFQLPAAALGADPAVIAHLEKLVGAFPITRFDSDTSLTQKVDTTNSISKYTLLGDTTVLYERDANDKNKEVVVLTEDGIPFKVSKKIYVVLRKKPNTDPAVYFTNVALLRLASDKDAEVIQVGDKKVVAEFDRFDEHFVAGRPAITFYTLQCASAFIVPCSFNENALSAEEKAAKAPRFAVRMVNASKLSELESVKAEVEDGTDPSCNKELYYDMQFNQNDLSSGAGRSMEGGQQGGAPLVADVQYYPAVDPASGVGAVGGLLSGIGGVVCGILSILASCADERAYHNMMPVGLAAEEGFKQNSWKFSSVFGRRKRRETLGYKDMENRWKFSEMALDPKTKRQAQPDLEAVLDYPGWKTQYAKPKTMKGIVSKTGIFYGLGNCPFVPTDAEGLKKATTDDALVDFYLTALRGHCIAWMKDFVKNLLSQGFLVVKDKALEATLSKETKLTLKETLKLSAAAELDAFTKVFVEEANNPTTAPKSQDGKDITRSTNFLIKAGIKALGRIMEYAPHHIIPMRRHFLQTFKQIFSKLRQDAQNLERCSDDCTKDINSNRNDRLQIIGMIRFIRYGSGALKIGADVKSYFDKFYTKNFDTIEKFVDLYV